jgi:hypothetical protein
MQDCINAIDGNSIDDWHVKTRNHSIEFIFRNATKIEGFILTAIQGGVVQPMTKGGENIKLAVQSALDTSGDMFAEFRHG